jgi:hypothetical protein
MKREGQKAMEEHMDKFFTEWGLKTLYSYTKELIKLHYKQKDYPFTVGIVMGIPAFNTTEKERLFNNKSELEGRIKGYMQLMCLKKIEVEMNNYTIIFDLGDK